MSDKPQMLSLCLLFLGWLMYLFTENLELLGQAVLHNSLNSCPAQAPEDILFVLFVYTQGPGGCPRITEGRSSGSCGKWFSGAVHRVESGEQEN